jgi:hypothetical protein
MRISRHGRGGTRTYRSFTAVRPGRLQRSCPCGGTKGQTETCRACNGNRLAKASRTAGRDATPTVPPIVSEVLHSPGRRLDAATRSFMEPRFGHDFSRVRVHDDSTAGVSARAVNAQAYTLGRHVVLGPGRYRPDTRTGRWLMAHELTHTIQQSSADGIGQAPRRFAPVERLEAGPLQRQGTPHH